MRNDVRTSVIGVSAVGATALLATLVDSRASDRPYERYLQRGAVTLRGSLRTFTDTHADFDTTAIGGAGRYVNIAADQLDGEGKPVFRSSGHLVVAQPTNTSGWPIMFPRDYFPSQAGDNAGSYATSATGPVTSAASFGEWYRDTPGVNVVSKGSVTLAHDPVNSTYRFDGHLGFGNIGPNGTSSTGLNTYEMDTTFVNHTGEGWWIEFETDADVWAYVDGQLVVDSASARGEQALQGNSLDRFTIHEGAVYPREAFVAEVEVLGSALQTSEYHMPVTVRVHLAADASDPYGPFNDAITANVNDNQDVTGWANSSPMEWLTPDNGRHSAGTSISVEATAWSGIQIGVGEFATYMWSEHATYRSNVDSDQVLVLRDGDPVPNIAALYNQADIEEYLGDYIDESKNEISLQDYQVIYLFELGEDGRGSSADFQDLVLLLSLAKNPEFFGETSGTTIINNAPNATQRIELDRLSWLEDGRTYDLSVFYADRDAVPSSLRMETNITTLNLAYPPMGRAEPINLLRAD